MPRREVTVIISPNYSAESIRLTLPLWLVRVLIGLAALLALLVAASLVMVLSGAYRLSRLGYLEQRNRQLETEFAKVGELRKQLEQMEEQSSRMAAMLGIEKTPPPVNWDSAPFDSSSMPEWLKTETWGAQLVPVILPLDEYAVSQAMSDPHPAVDLAAKTGTPVRATADGIVTQRGSDRTFGRFLLLAHGKQYESYYGHLEDWNVDKGDTVRAGHTIGWVGSTGKSTAPHLHFEIRRAGLRIDPTTLLKL